MRRSVGATGSNDASHRAFRNHRPIGRQPRVDLIYLLPLGDWKAFEAALLSMASQFIGRVRLIRTGRAKLGQFTNARVFLSNTVPNFILLLGGSDVPQEDDSLPLTDIQSRLERPV